jgi:hypothetical protein
MVKNQNNNKKCVAYPLVYFLYKYKSTDIFYDGILVIEKHFSLHVKSP